MNKEKVDGFFEYFNEDGSLDYSEEWADGYLREKKHHLCFYKVWVGHVNHAIY